jgi:hypothetical protein
VAPEAIQEVTSFLSNTGISGAPHHLFYVQVRAHAHVCHMPAEGITCGPCGRKRARGARK